MDRVKIDRDLYKNDILYRFFSQQISDVEYKISINSEKLKSLSREQEELKRGKKKLVELRRELKHHTTAV
jgi:hypothetical protein